MARVRGALVVRQAGARPLPAVKQAGWVQNPIDNFVLAKLEKNGLAPEPEADPRTLLRRVTLDLTGLPPTPEEVDAFVADKSPDAYEKAVDRLLASPHYGEHEARYWLDAARYAETVGLHFDEPTSIYPYRDYVIKAFNENKPFDKFTVEQVAGDLLPTPRWSKRWRRASPAAAFPRARAAASRPKCSPATPRKPWKPTPPPSWA